MLHKFVSICVVSACYISSAWSFTCPKSATVRSINGRISTSVWGSKWDNLIDEDEDELQFNGGPPVPRDMKYNMFNIDRQRKNFESMKAVVGKDLMNDVYARDPETDTFWFIGKVTRVSDVPLEKAMARQWPMIEEHSARLRSDELYPKWGSIELWTAPVDSEMDVAYNRPEIQFIQMFRDVEDADKVRNVEVGFAGELYDKGEEGFRTTRTADGRPAKPELMPPQDKKRTLSDEEINEMIQALQNEPRDGE